jgi:arthrofactin-type cyclic lipopeptide synthetase C
MATRLQAAGRTVESLTIVDTDAPDDQGTQIKHCNHMEVIRKWLEIFEMITERSLGLNVEKLAELPEADQLSLVHERLVQFGLVPCKSTPALLQGPLHNFANALRARFTPKSTYNGRVHLALIKDSRPDKSSNINKDENVAKEWIRWAPTLDVIYLPGNHMTALKVPYVHAMARIIRE